MQNLDDPLKNKVFGGRQSKHPATLLYLVFLPARLVPTSVAVANTNTNKIRVFEKFENVLTPVHVAYSVHAHRR